MLSKLMIVLTTITIVGSSVASGALAAPYHGAGEDRGAGEARYFSGANASEHADGAGYAAVGEVNNSGYGVSEPRYHGGPKSAY